MIAAIIATVVSVPLVILTIETLAGLARPKQTALTGSMPRTTILIPAHNEESGIAAVITAIKAQCADILVVADN